MSISTTAFLKLCWFLLLPVLMMACRKDNGLPPCGDSLFGRPIPSTGLDANRCSPSCVCKDFISTEFSQQQLQQLLNWTLVNPFAELTANPYQQPLPDKCECVCAISVVDISLKTYRVNDFNSPQAAKAAGAILTHYDACGVCSTLQDFTVYAGNLDVGAAVKTCGLQNFFSPFDSLVACVERIGFTKPCAQIWAYNLRNTQTHCLQFCLADTFYNKPDGSLSDCLACDEAQSGPVFKAIAGRTRRNTGIATAICRFCEEVQPVAHDYPF